MRGIILDKVHSEAKELDRKYNFFITHSGDSRKTGYPMIVKDSICVKDVQATAGSRILEGYKPPFEATAVSLLRKEGFAVIGKSTQDEFGFGTFSTNSAYGIPKNPYDPTRSCGGSSGGVAGYVAASKHRVFGLGQSTGGSITAPASFCGVVGITPTYGLVSRYGLIDYSNSLDKIGPITKTVRDAAFMLSIIAKHDPRDSTSIKLTSKDYTQFCGKSIKGLTVGVPKEYLVSLDSRVKKVFLKLVDGLKSEGVRIKTVSLPYTKAALAAYYILATAEASTNLAKFCGMRYGLSTELKGEFNEYFSKVRTKGFGKEAKRRILLGTFARMAGYRYAYYLNALKVRTLVIRDFKKAFSKVDVLLAPAMPIMPPTFGEIEKLRPSQVYQMDILTVPSNLAGIPQLCVPAGKAGGLPVGVQLIADHLREDILIKVGDAIERS